MIEKYWYHAKVHPILLLLLPFSWLFSIIIKIRRKLYVQGYKKISHLAIPVIIVGNINVGGTGKSQVVIWLAKLLQQHGYKVGIALRGYGSTKHHHPVQVNWNNALPEEVGDESILLAENTSAAVVVCTNRVAAAQKLQDLACTIVICDDGLQHYSLARQLEIAVVDGTRYFGNKLLLPAGPLREPITRLKTVDFILINEQQHPEQDLCKLNYNTYPVTFKPLGFVALVNPAQIVSLQDFAATTVHAIAGIGNPERFFVSLNKLGLKIIPHVFPDHYLYQEHDLNFNDNLNIIMTEKDAIKCRNYLLHTKKLWYLKVELVTTVELPVHLLTAINAIHKGGNHE